jgi:hypothetical protein
MNPIPTEEIKTGFYKYVTRAKTIYFFHIFKKTTNRLISFHYTNYPIPHYLVWKTLYEIDINNFHGKFYKINTGIQK